MALGNQDAITKGVDSASKADLAVDTAGSISREHGSVVCITGETDYIVKNNDIIKIRNGHAMMPRVTGLGCTASALCGAFAAVNSDPVQAAAHALAVMGIAGEMAGRTASGPGSFQVQFLDALYQMTETDIQQRFKA
jgi:hydroxyethylthiazole kinase